MTINIVNYSSKMGVLLKKACLSTSQLVYTPRERRVSFSADVYVDENSSVPAEANVISGSFVIDPTEIEEPIDFERLIEQVILNKIEAVRDKTPQECTDHNSTCESWLDLWDISYQRFILDDGSTEADTDEDYIMAAKILLEGE